MVPFTVLSRPSPTTLNKAFFVTSWPGSIWIKSIKPVQTAVKPHKTLPIVVAIIISPVFSAHHIVIVTGISIIKVKGL